MNCWPIILLCVLTETGCSDEVPEPVISPGDFILAKAKVRNCEDWGEFAIAYGNVEVQQVTILDHVLAAAGLRPSEFEASLKKAVMDEIGRPPKTLRIEVLTEDEFIAQQWNIEADIDRYHAAIRACDKKMDEFRERTKDVA